MPEIKADVDDPVAALADDETPEAGVREARELTARLGIRPDRLVDGAHVDLLRGRPD